MPNKNYERAFAEDNVKGLDCCGRLTLLSGTAIPTTDQLAKTTIYFTPHRGDLIAIYDPTVGNEWWRGYRFTEKSVAVPATTVTPFDIFAYVDANGQVAIETLNWTNDTTRATALVLQNGIYCKTGDLSRRYLGTGRTTGINGQCEDSVSKRFLVNYHNPVERFLQKQANVNHTYNVAAWRAWNNDQTNIIEFIVPVLERAMFTAFVADVTAGAAGQLDFVGIGLDVYNAIVRSFASIINANASEIRAGNGYYITPPAIGYHFLSILEFGNATNPATYNQYDLSAMIMG